MKKFFKAIGKFLSTPRVLIFILFAALACLVWFVGPLVAFSGDVFFQPINTRLVAIIILAIFWGICSILVPSKKSKQANQAASLTEEGEEEDDDETAESAQDAVETNIFGDSVLKKLQHDFHTALQMTGNLFWNKRKNIRPWYLIIGNAGSGKSALLKQLDADPLLGNPEDFVAEERQDYCNWHLGNQAIFLDMAGQFTQTIGSTQYEKELRQTMLQLLKKHATKNPLQGIVLTVSLSELLQPNKEKQIAHTKMLRQCLQELIAQQGYRAPVYLVVTKCDELSGFNDFFHTLSPEQREQLWGINFPDLSSNKGAVPAAFSAEFDKLISRLNGGLNNRLNLERSAQNTAKLIGFPQQIASLKPLLQTFLKQITHTLQEQEEPFMRGVFFTSAMQGNTILPHLNQEIDQYYGLQFDEAEQNPHAAGVIISHAYFVAELFRDFILQETQIIKATKARTYKTNWQRGLLYGGAISLLLSSSAIWLNSYHKNFLRINELKEEAKSLASLPTLAAQDSPSNILLTLSRLRKINAVFPEKDVPLPLTFGLYVGDETQALTHTIYQYNLQKHFLPLLLNALTEEISSSTSTVPLYQALVVYLMFGNPEQMQKERVSHWFSHYFQSAFSDNPELQTELDQHLAALLGAPIPAQKLNQRLIRNVRGNLSLLPLSLRIYSELEATIAAKYAPLNFSDRVTESIEQTLEYSGDTLAMPILFTKEGYNDVYQKQADGIIREAIKNDWVISGVGVARLSLAKQKTMHTQVQKNYVQDYISHWNSFLNNIKIVPFDTLEQAEEALAILSAENSPLEEVLNLVKENTKLVSTTTEKTSNKLAKKRAANSPAMLITNAFNSVNSLTDSTFSHGHVNTKNLRVKSLKKSALKSQVKRSTRKAMRGSSKKKPGFFTGAKFTTPIKAILASLGTLHAYLDEINSAEDPSKAAFIAAQKYWANPKNPKNIFVQLNTEAQAFPEPMSTWLTTISSDSWHAVLTEAQQYIMDAWQTQVFPFYGKNIHAYYPFNKRAKIAVSIPVFSKFFGSTGILTTFTKHYLLPFIDTSGGNWQWKTINGKSIGFSRSTLVQLQHANEIEEAFFSGGAAAGTGTASTPSAGNAAVPPPSISFNLKPTYLDAYIVEFDMLLDGTKLIYRHGPGRFTSFTWPPKPNAQTIQLSFTDLDGHSVSAQYDGPWALFRLLDDNHLGASQTPAAYNVSLNIQAHHVNFLLTTNSVKNPFNLGNLHTFRLPKTL